MNENILDLLDAAIETDRPKYNRARFIMASGRVRNGWIPIGEFHCARIEEETHRFATNDAGRVGPALITRRVYEFRHFDADGIPVYCCTTSTRPVDSHTILEFSSDLSKL